MIGFNHLVAVCLAYVLFLFWVAFAVERPAARRGQRWLRSPLVYTLSLSIYCTAWTFYGAVGYAARSGLEFVTIYLGPTLVFVGWWWVLRKLVRIGRSQRVTSIADLIAARYGKSNAIGVLATLIAVVAATPYIALQLQSVTLALGAFAAEDAAGSFRPGRDATAAWVAVGLVLFTVLFGTRTLDANEQHSGVVMAIAVEAVVKLLALAAVGCFVVWGLAGGPAQVFARIEQAEIPRWAFDPGRWVGLTLLSGAAILCLPRMFQVMVVENVDERHLATASWAFPLYLFAMSLFVLPIAVMGMAVLPPGSNPDLYVLTLPLATGQDELAMLAFLGGFSSATSMVIVAAIALATMVSNHILMPIWLGLRRDAARQGDLRGIVLMARRLSIAGIVALGYGYYRLSGGSSALAAIGLISFVGAAQVLPAMLGGLFWRGATRVGAAAGMTVGGLVWAYALFLPSFGAGAPFPAEMLAEGPFGIGWLRPQALFGTDGMDPLLHAAFWSLSLNAAAFCAGSILSFPTPLERVQGAAFVHVFDDPPGAPGWRRGEASAEDLLVMAQGILGDEAAQALFRRAALAQGKAAMLPDPTAGFIGLLEREMAASVGSATAHAMIAQLAGGETLTVDDLMAMANETAQIVEYSAQLEQKSDELARTARQLREANAKLTQLSAQKDGFLSQISHELRTPMTSIRAFSEILMAGDLPPDTAARYARIIHDEAIRLTRLLDDLLDLSVLENGTVRLSPGTVRLDEVIDRALAAAGSTRPERVFAVLRDPPSEAVHLRTDPDRLTQVLINLISNARKYCQAAAPELRIRVRQRGGSVAIDVIDNGTGIPEAARALVFEKFARLSDPARSGGAGLGLAICREVMANLGGGIDYLPGQGGTAFRVTVPLRIPVAA